MAVNWLGLKVRMLHELRHVTTRGMTSPAKVYIRFLLAFHFHVSQHFVFCSPPLLQLLGSSAWLPLMLHGLARLCGSGFVGVRTSLDPLKTARATMNSSRLQHLRSEARMTSTLQAFQILLWRSYP
jgi:hypothetical protein